MVTRWLQEKAGFGIKKAGEPGTKRRQPSTRGRIRQKGGTIMGMMKNVRERYNKWKKERERKNMKKNSLEKTPRQNFSNFSQSSPDSAGLSIPTVKMGKYRFTKQYKNGSFTGIAVKLNVPKKSLPLGDKGYRGFIRPSIWRHYVLDGETPTASKVEHMLRVSQAIRAGYVDQAEALRAETSDELPSHPQIRAVK